MNTPDESSVFPEVLGRILERQDQIGGFFVARMVGEVEFAYLLGGVDKVLLREANAAAERARIAADVKDVVAEMGGTCATVLVAAAACEARLSEHLAHEEAMGDGLSAELTTVRSLRNAREQWNAFLKVMLPTFASGSSREFQALGCLFKLRDLVAHRSARLAMPDAFPETIVDCLRQRIVPAARAADMEWTTALFVADVASWAFRAAGEWIELVDRELPIGHGWAAV